MIRRFVLLVAAAEMLAGTAHGQRVDITAQLTGLKNPSAVQAGQLVTGAISEGDYVAGATWNSDVLAITARAGERITLQLKSNIPTIELHVHSIRSRTGNAIVEGPATSAPLAFVVPKDGTYLIFVHAKGPERFGKYVLAIGDGHQAPAFDPPPAPEVAERSTAAPAPTPVTTTPEPTREPLQEPASILSAKALGATELKIGSPARIASSTKPVAEVYYLVGEVGAKDTFVLSGKGSASLTLFGPDGSELLTSSGNAPVKLEVVLPFTDVFTLAVSRRDTAEAYTLLRQTTVPTLAEAKLAASVGYLTRHEGTSRCWLVPGVKARTVGTDQIVELTLAADRNTVSYFAKEAKTGKTGSGEVTYFYDVTGLHEVIKNHNGEMNEEVGPLGLSYNDEAFGRFAGYSCKD